MNFKERRMRKESKIKKSREYNAKKELLKIGKTYKIENKPVKVETNEVIAENKEKTNRRPKPKQNKYKQPLMKDRLSNLLTKITKE